MSDEAKAPADNQETVDDAVQRIIDQDETGVGTALRVLEKTEEQYYRAAAQSAPVQQVISRSGTAAF